MSTKQPRKSVLITGCSPGGIGHALAREFHARGLHVIASARNKDAITDLEALGMATLSLEVTSEESIRDARVTVEKLTGGRLDILVNNAGRNCTLPALDVPLNEARATFETNLFGPIALTQSLIPLLIASRGLILNIGSVAAVTPYVFGSVYNASKAALHAWSNTLRLELDPFDVRVLVIVTGGVKSRIARTERRLAEGSLYLEIEKEFLKRVIHSQDGAMDTDIYAKGVVDEALKGTATKKWLWRGNKSSLIWWVSQWLGGWIFDWVIPGMFGLRRLKGIVRARGGR
ncbi:short chain dehydrogenase [Diplocarpon rosae]|nr:short chain dehydrogenase [Diplocarpon rosae]